MKLTLSDLAHFREGDKTTGYVPAPLVLDRPPLSLLCFDQTLGNCAMVMLDVADGTLTIKESVTLRPQSGGVKGMEGTLRQSVALQEMLLAKGGLLEEVARAENRLIVFERPAVRGYRIESSLLASAAVAFAANWWAIPTVALSAQSAKGHVCGNHRAEKAEAHAALKQHYGHLPGYHLVTNGDERDALLLGLLHLAPPRTAGARSKK